MEVSGSTKLDSWLMSSWKEGIDYEETFAPLAIYTLIRATMALAAKLGWKLHQMDVKTTFLNGVVVGHNTHIERGGESVCGHSYQFF